MKKNRYIHVNAYIYIYICIYQFISLYTYIYINTLLNTYKCIDHYIYRNDTEELRTSWQASFNQPKSAAKPETQAQKCFKDAKTQ